MKEFETILNFYEKNPNKLVFFKSSDKEHYQQPDLKDLANCCTPVFCIISGNVNCGKTSLLKTLLVHKHPHYERIVVYSPLGEATTEYSDVIDCELIDYVTSAHVITGNEYVK